MNQTTKFLIVEDDFLISETISDILIKAGYPAPLQASSVDGAVQLIKTEKPDMVLSDIELGEAKNGIDLGVLLQNEFHLPFIYITSHSSSEILNKAKHTMPNAYIIKPFKNEDLLVAIELALFNTSQKKDVAKNNNQLIVKEGRAMIRIDVDNIQWLENDSNYTSLYLGNNKRRVIRGTLSELQEQLPASDFIRIHKSFIVNKNHVTETRTASVLINDKEFPIGRKYIQDVKVFFN